MGPSRQRRYGNCKKVPFLGMSAAQLPAWSPEDSWVSATDFGDLPTEGLPTPGGMWRVSPRSPGQSRSVGSWALPGLLPSALLIDCLAVDMNNSSIRGRKPGRLQIGGSQAPPTSRSSGFTPLC